MQSGERLGLAERVLRGPGGAAQFFSPNMVLEASLAAVQTVIYFGAVPLVVYLGLKEPATLLS
jgi:hypothetical protein